MSTYSVTREWRAGLRLDADALRAIDRSIRAILQGESPSASLSLELSNSTVLNGQALDDVLSEPNSPGRLYEVLTLEYHSQGHSRLDEQLESAKVAFSRRESQPALVMTVTAPSRERLALIAREVESRLESSIVDKSLLTFLLTPPNRNDLSPLTQLAMLVPIGTMMWTSWSIRRELAVSTRAFDSSLPAGATAVEVGKALANLMDARSASANRQQLVVMLSLALLVGVWVMVSQMSVGSGVALNRQFLIGDYASKYNASLAFRSRLLWSGGVGLLVSLVGSALIYFLTK